MRDYAFNVQLAKESGVDEAIFIHSLEFWIRKNCANGRHFHDGRWWTYNSLAALCELFPFWTRRQLERIIASCREKGLVYTGDYNADRKMRTTWYALADAVFELYGDAECISQNGEMPENTEEAFHGTVTAISPNGEMLCNKEPVSIPTDTPPYPPEGDGEPGSQQKKRPKSVPRWKPERFEGFWRLYPRGEDRAGAVQAWDRLKPDDDLIAEMGRGLARQLQSEDWQRGIGIPYACRWLRNRRWEDKPKAAPLVAGDDAPASAKEVLPEWT